MRHLIAFRCEGEALAGTLDAAAGAAGVLIVSGGTEIRIGPHRGMATLAAMLAADGIPVFRYDRRGVGDSTGIDRGWTEAAADLAAAAAAFRTAQPQLTRIVGLGNCDAATTLALFGRAAGLDRVVLTNPWLREEADALPPAAAIRARYATRLRQPAAWARLLRGGVDLRKLLAGLRKLTVPHTTDPLAERVLAAMAAWHADATIMLADGDATGTAFARAAKGHGLSIATVATASHSFADRADMLADAVMAAVQRA